MQPFVNNMISERRFLSEPGDSLIASGQKRLLLAEEALKGHSGHFYEYDRAVVIAHQQLGFDVRVAAHIGVTSEVCSEIGATPVFKYTNWDGIYDYPQFWRRQAGIICHNYRLYKTMRSFLRQSGYFECVFAPTVTIYHVIGWNALARTELGRSVGRVVLLFRNSIGEYRGDGAPTLSRFRRLIWRLLAKTLAKDVSKGRILLATDSMRLAEEYALLAGLNLQVLPHPHLVTPTVQPQKYQPGDAFTFGCLGPARLEKGIDLLQNAIKAFFAARPDADVRFVIQWNNPIRLPDGRIMAPDPVLVADNRITILDQSLTSWEYDKILNTLNCMVLPYRRASYAARISGVAVEAASVGIPVIYTQGTWIADFICTRGAGIAVQDEDSVDLARALIRIYDVRLEFADRARACAPSVREAHSAEAFIRALWGSQNAR